MTASRETASRAREVISALAACTGALFAWLHWGGPALATLVLATLFLALAALFAPALYRPVFRIIDGAIQVLLVGVSWLLLAAVFAGVFIPARLCLLIARKRAFQAAPDPLLQTYWSRPRPDLQDGHYTRTF